MARPKASPGRRTRRPSRQPRTIQAGREVRTAIWKKPLVRAAAEAREFGCAPYSKFRVGSALLTAEGRVITGANVESASYGLTCCAERVALFKALTQGHTNFVALAVVARAPGGALPCGACRQLLAEYAPRATVWVADARFLGKIKAHKMSELLPEPFLRLPQSSRKSPRSR